MQTEVKYLLEIVKYILNGRVGKVKLPAKDLDWDRLIQLAQAHSILNYVYYWVEDLPQECRPNEDHIEFLEKANGSTLVRTAYQIEGARELFERFEQEGLYVIGIKGICTRQRYPQSDLRTMGDLDLVYQTSQHKQVKNAMLQMDYNQVSEERQHDCYVRKPYLMVEMHRDLMDTESSYYSYYETVWSRVHPKDGCTYIYEMSLEDEYIYNLIHLVKHFQTGGIGIRFLMDVYVYNHITEMNWDYLEEELKKLKLREFLSNLSDLSERWFGVGTEIKDTAVLKKLEQYIVANTTFGNSRNAMSVATAKKGRFGTLWRAVFPNLKAMQSMFVWLEKWPILLPYAWVLRGFRSITTKKRRGHIKYRISGFLYGEREYGEDLRRFFKECGL